MGYMESRAQDQIEGAQIQQAEHDRELLKLAAKAAGLDCWFSKDWHDKGGCYIGELRNPTAWNPLLDDGDALRLAVKIGQDLQPIFVLRIRKNGVAVDDLGKRGFIESCLINRPYDPWAATRRAIVRAAAAKATGASND